MKYLKLTLLLSLTIFVYFSFFNLINVDNLNSFKGVLALMLALLGTGLVVWTLFILADIVPRVSVTTNTNDETESNEAELPAFFKFTQYVSICLAILILPAAFYAHASSKIEKELEENGKIVLGRIVNPNGPIPREGVAIYYSTPDGQKITNHFKVTKITITGLSNDGMVPILYSQKYPKVASIMDDVSKLKRKFPELAQLSPLSEILEFAKTAGINNKLNVLNKHNQLWTYEPNEDNEKRIIYIDRLRDQAFLVDRKDTNLCFYSTRKEDETRLRDELLAQGFEIKSTDKDVLYFKYPFVIMFNTNERIFSEVTSVLEVNYTPSKSAYDLLVWLINNDEGNKHSE